MIVESLSVISCSRFLSKQAGAFLSVLSRSIHSNLIFFLYYINLFLLDFFEVFTVVSFIFSVINKMPFFYLINRFIGVITKHICFYYGYGKWCAKMWDNSCSDDASHRFNRYVD